MAEVLLAFRNGDQGDLGLIGAVAVADGLANLRFLAEAYAKVHGKK